MKRIYVVTSKDGKSRVVRAENASRALKVVARDYTVKLATQEELVESIGSGVIVEDEPIAQKQPDAPAESPLSSSSGG